jgi:hypothetical protein
MRPSAVRPAAAARRTAVRVQAAGRTLWLPDTTAPSRELPAHAAPATPAAGATSPISRPHPTLRPLPPCRPERHPGGRRPRRGSSLQQQGRDGDGKRRSLEQLQGLTGGRRGLSRRETSALTPWAWASPPSGKIRAGGPAREQAKLGGRKKAPAMAAIGGRAGGMALEAWDAAAAAAAAGCCNGGGAQ